MRLRIQILADQALPHVHHDVAVLAGPHKVLQGLRYNRVIIAEPLFLLKSKRRLKKKKFHEYFILISFSTENLLLWMHSTDR